MAGCQVRYRRCPIHVDLQLHSSWLCQLKRSKQPLVQHSMPGEALAGETLAVYGACGLPT